MNMHPIHLVKDATNVTKPRANAPAPKSIRSLIADCIPAMAENDRCAKLERGGSSKAACLSQQRLAAAFKQWKLCFDTLMATVPTTPEEVSALAAHVLRTWEWGGEEVVTYDELVSLMKSLRRYGERQEAPARLGVQLERAWTAYASQRPEYEKSCSDRNARLYQSLKDNPVATGPDLKTWFARDEQLRTKKGETARRLNEKTYDAVSKVIEAIQNKSCENLQDLAALANACAAANDHLWDEPLNDLDWDDGFVRHLVEAVLAVAGSENILHGLPIPQPVEQDAMQRIANGE